jgi:hypothetical protein
MKFLCVACDEPMRLTSTTGPDQGSLCVTFACPACRHQVAMLTNPWETQLVQTLGVKVGGRQEEARPYEQVRSALARQRDGALIGEAVAPVAEGPGCPFAAMIPASGTTAADAPSWTPEALARIERVPDFIRPMARQAVERFAREQGYPAITEEVMDQARGRMGM